MCLRVSRNLLSSPHEFNPPITYSDPYLLIAGAVVCQREREKEKGASHSREGRRVAWMRNVAPWNEKKRKSFFLPIWHVWRLQSVFPSFVSENGDQMGRQKGHEFRALRRTHELPPISTQYARTLSEESVCNSSHFYIVTFLLPRGFSPPRSSSCFCRC